MTATVGIVCDGCRTTLTRTTRVQVRVTVIRAEAHERGWHKTKGIYTYGGRTYGYTRDICPDCWKEGTR